MALPQASRGGIATPEPAARKTISVRDRLLLVAVLTGTFLSMLNDFIVNVATPAIRTELGATYAEVQLVIGGYILVYGVALVTGGRLGDIFGHRRMFLLGTGLFTLSSLACGLAPNPALLIAFRIAQALSAALFYPQVLSILQLVFTGRARAKAFSAFGATIGLASIAGQLIGGMLIGADLFGLTWRPIFLINVPVGLIAIAIAAWTLPKHAGSTGTRLDLPGAGLLSATLVLLIFPLVQGRELGWPVWTVGLLVLSAPALLAFLRWERRVADGARSPLVPPELHRIRGFGVGNAIALLFFAGNSGLFFLLPLQLQSGLGHSALHSGLTFTPLAVTFTLGSLLAPKLAPRLGNRVLSLGYAINVVGNTIVLVIVISAGTEVTGWLLAPAMAVVGLGQGLGMSPLVAAALADVPGKHSGAASGVIQTVMQVGMAFGVTVIGLVFFAALGSGTGPVEYSRAFTVALITQPLLALLALALVPLLTTGEERSAAAQS
ncbi:drug resistance transporter, EmrB/QacA subfamily [Saccharopolyspora antimicrobica]|uniref:Drug resistance transporter, EmrB/QacA subfamily n=1 Tax=Saccharopolyspora antimicrobica TaxID=455193 RepID=A0A1I5E8J0_9PSEU|nr:MFS transporter [Saccharopolyspora antimicrobica]RKT86706.1 EmrB/QacA subfamily drug resistance transporter [Saccharopolyspora antimicrobica]SFO07586.1 drug resistance transporter, EmrB/QacA subfamily [Saccharopolyspora antimicrobica]